MEKKTNYEKMAKELEKVLHHKNYLMGNLANASAVINNNMEDVNWVGFYLLHKDELFLGPFQGSDIAKTRVPLFKGLIGKAMRDYETKVDNDSAMCPCAEQCEDLVKSEIAIPIFYNREPVGVLNIDSTKKDRFSAEDVKALEEMAVLVQKVWRHMY
ncbi:MAG: GAF domain-containing protein [Firmicutes bacterium]|nr:GAF domain-containing protein [Bacillota bacterium]